MWTTTDVFGMYTPARWHSCPVCGYLEINGFDADRANMWSAWSVLKLIESVDDAESIAISEVASHVVGHRDRIATLSPRRVEELVNHLFREQGFTTELTKQTRDGGRDLLILGHPDGATVAVVEVKHYRGTVGVRPVRELRGVQLRDGVSDALLVCTSEYSADARLEAQAPYPQSLGFSMTLADIHDVLLLLDLHVNPRTAILSQLASLEEGGVPLGVGLSRFLPGGVTIRSRHRCGAVVGHSHRGRSAVAVLGRRGDGVRQYIPQTGVALPAPVNEVTLGTPEELSAVFNVEQWPVLGWNDLATTEYD